MFDPLENQNKLNIMLQAQQNNRNETCDDAPSWPILTAYRQYKNL